MQKVAAEQPERLANGKRPEAKIPCKSADTSAGGGAGSLLGSAVEG